MPTKILIFDPLVEEEVEKAEHEVERRLNRGWKIVSSIGGNRSGRQGGRGLMTERVYATSSPVSRDYIMLILHQRVPKPTDVKSHDFAANQSHNGTAEHETPLQEEPVLRP